MKDLTKLWEEFGNIPIDDDDLLEQSFLHFSIGTDRIEVWGWFDENDIKGVAHLMGIAA